MIYIFEYKVITGTLCRITKILAMFPDNEPKLAYESFQRFAEARGLQTGITPVKKEGDTGVLILHDKYLQTLIVNLAEIYPELENGKEQSNGDE